MREKLTRFLDSLRAHNFPQRIKSAFNREYHPVQSVMQSKSYARFKAFRLRALFYILGIFMIMAALFFAERMGIQIGDLVNKDPYWKAEDSITVQTAVESRPKTCLLITDLGREDCTDAYTELKQILWDMKVNFDTVDVGCEPVPTDFSPYKTVVVALPDMSPLGNSAMNLADWVFDGGRAMFPMTPDATPISVYLLQKAGVNFYGDNTVLESIYFDKDFVIGGGRAYNISDPFDSCLSVTVRDEAEVYAWAGEEGGMPVIWSYDYGDGRFVVDNIGLYEKSLRGLYSASYTLLEDVFAYPVIDGLIVFLDDMPSPVPEGDSQYIRRDYDTTIADYYVNTWYPDIDNLSKKYGFPLVGLVIENYEQQVDGTVERQADTSRFQYFGNQILRSGGELGYHGYNHQPLCVGDEVDYTGLFDYKTWDSVSAISSGFGELISFCQEQYPTAKFSVYVPPSNIMSAQGRTFIGSLYPTVRTISGFYLPDGDSGMTYVHEFGVAEDGMVELPRVTSGSVPEPYMALLGLSELNMHMVFSHFIHPDDALDVDRGAEIGWPTLSKNLDKLFGSVDKIVPSIRRLSSIEMSGSIQRWAALTVDQKMEHTEDQDIMHITLGNYVDEGRLFVRFQNGAPNKVTGGKLTPLTGTLYLLEANQAEITLEWNR